MNPRRLKAPSKNGSILAVPDFDAVPALVESNRKLLNNRFSELRQQARRDLGITDDAPILITGHQPELFHPGVWVKNFALCGVAKKLGGHGVNLIADTDTLKSASIRVPISGTLTVLGTLPFDDAASEQPYESRPIRNPQLVTTFPRRLSELARDWPFVPLGVQHAPAAESHQIGVAFTRLRQSVETAWGCTNREITVQAMVQFESFREFVRIIARDADSFRDCYNTAIRDYRRVNKLRSKHHPAAELDAGELPFWTLHDGRRNRTFGIDDIAAIRPKALTLTLFARLILGEYFIHGIGGGKYDVVTDTIVRTYFHMEPPAYQVLTATLHLPFPNSSTTTVELADMDRLLRDLSWNPHRYLDPSAQQRHKALTLLPVGTRQERRERFRRLHALREELLPRVVEKRAAVSHQERQLRMMMQRDAILTRRDYAWVLHPESSLKPFLTQFLNGTHHGG